VDAGHWMVAPVVACLVVALPLGWFGLHVLQRGVIFVDLALAQVAALGTTWAVMLGFTADAPGAYGISLGFTAVGALAFSLARHFEDRVPQEAIIGIAYAVTAGAAALVLEFASDPHGAEKLQHLLVGNVVWVRWSEIAWMAGVVAAVGAVHFAVRQRLLRVSFEPEAAQADGVAVGAWDIFFYLSFGAVITAMVPIAGVLLIFSFLVIPAVIGRLFADGVGARLALAWGVALPVSVVGVGVSYEHAAGPVIVVMLGGLLVMALAVRALRSADRPGPLAAKLAAGAATLGATLWAVALTSPSGAAHDHDQDVHLEHHEEAALADQDPATREARYRAELDDGIALRAGLAVEPDPSLRLLVASALVRLGDPAGLDGLADLVEGDVPFLRMEADHRLRLVAGDTAPAYDPLAGPDSSGAWADWVRKAPEGWRERAGEVALP